MRVLIAHLRGNWGGYWPLTLLPPIFLMVLVLRAEARPEHWIAVGVITAAALKGGRARDLLLAVLPGIAIVFGYEMVRYLRPIFVTPERVLACQMHRWDAQAFGFGTGAAPADWFLNWHSPVADLVFALPYTLFWGVVVIWALVLFFTHRPLLRRFLWTLAVVHLLAFVIWLAFPAAPPWYVHSVGCQIDTAVLPSPAALGRLDDRFGIGYFHAFYSRAPTVFGAMPSLHVAFPTVAAVTGWRVFSRAGRIISASLVLWMLAASVYLDHHWLWDGVVSIALVVMVHGALVRFWPAYGALTDGGRA